MGCQGSNLGMAVCKVKTFPAVLMLIPPQNSSLKENYLEEWKGGRLREGEGGAGGRE